MKKLVLSTLFVLQALFVFAQENPALTGKVIDGKSQNALQNVVVSIQSTNQSVLTNSEGNGLPRCPRCGPCSGRRGEGQRR